MTATDIAADVAADPGTDLVERFATLLTRGALPGELENFPVAQRHDAAAFVASAAARRAPGAPAIHLDSDIEGRGRRLMRLGIVNDDMPFLVDSIAGAIAARSLGVHRILHPIVAARRDGDGRLVELVSGDATGERRESVIYMEIDRADADERAAIHGEVAAILADVRAAVADWPRMQVAMREEAERLPDGEGAALVRWFLDGHFTLLGHQTEDGAGVPRDRLGILRVDGAALWSDAARAAAIAHFAAGGEAPLLLKADRFATVHRRVPLDLVVLPVRDGGTVAGLSVHCGLWTSAALAARPDRVPVLRRRLAGLEEKYGFAPSSHAGKALRHTLSALPHDILIAVAPATLETIALTAMGLGDRPRSKLLLARGPLGAKLFAFVWLPREEFSTSQRVRISAMLETAAQGEVSSWSLDLGDGDLAFLRLTLDIAPDAPMPDAAALDARIEEMMRGWAPAMEAAIAQCSAQADAQKLVATYAAAFPPGYRARYSADAAAEDVLRLAALARPEARSARLYRVEGEAGQRLHLKIYRTGGIVPLSDVVPVLENFGFRVLEEVPTVLDGGALGHIHEFVLEIADATGLFERVAVTEAAICAVLEGDAENDAFNQLLVIIGLSPRAVVLFRAWFRYLRQTGLSYGLATVVEALREAPGVARNIIDLFDARHDPANRGAVDAGIEAAIDAGLAEVAAIDDDRILRRLRAVVDATLRTNAFASAAREALAFKLDSSLVPGLPAPVPWREIWVYSPRVEGIHLRAGPVARGGLRWSDRRDDFRTEILGLMKAQVVKNAVIVPTGAKGGFYPKQLPSPAVDRKAWLAEGTESYRIFIRSLLSVTDNLVAGAVVHPDGVAIRDGDDPYFVVAADKGTATFSDIANAIALERGFWLGDAFASGGSNGYDHKAMGITARGAWVSVTRHFAEAGIDVQADPVITAGCGDMSGDVFGNGMLLSKSLKIVAAYDHRHIFLDPDPDPAKSWDERARLFALPTSSWADYDATLISAGGGVYPRSQKAIPISPQVQARLGIAADTLDPSGLINAILRARIDLLWFGGIGTYIKGPLESHAEVGDPANDAHRVNGDQVGAKVIGEGANLSTTQAGRIAFALAGGRVNTDFVDNSAGVDCSDNEVNIKIPLNGEMILGTLAKPDRDALLVTMTDDVAQLVLEDNRLQTLALSIAEAGGAAALPAQVRGLEMLETAGRLDRAVEGLAGNEELLRRAHDGKGLTRPELAVLLSHAKLALQAAIEADTLTDDRSLDGTLLHPAFPPAMLEKHRASVDDHALRREIIATKLANRVVNRMGPLAALELAEEEGVGLAQVAGGYVAVGRLLGIADLWQAIEQAPVSEPGRIELLRWAASGVRLHIADLLRVAPPGARPGDLVAELGDGVARLDAATAGLLKAEARSQSALLATRLSRTGAAPALIARIVRLFELDGAIGTAALSRRIGVEEVAATAAYTRIGEALGLDWAKAAATRSETGDPWERLLVAGLARDFEQLRLDFLGRLGAPDPLAAVEAWLAAHVDRVARFTALVARARTSPSPSAAMLAQVAAQARMLLAR